MRVIRQHPIAFFVAAAFVVTYPIGIGAFLAIRALYESAGLDLRFASELVLKFGPSLAGILTIALIAGRRGLIDLLRRCIRFRGPALLYVAALLVQPVVLVSALVLLGHGSALAELELIDALTVFAIQLLLNVFWGGGLGEEIGWRGFMLPMLSTRYSLLSTSLIIAIAWLAWHLPAYILFDKASSDPLLPFAVILFPFSIALGWIYLRSQESLSLPILLHGSINAAYYTLEQVLPSITERADFQPAFDWWLAGIWCVLAALVLMRSWPFRAMPR